MPLKCPSCGHENRDAAAFCEQCGARLARVCPDCRTELRPSARFCDACGRRVEAPAATGAVDLRAVTPPHLAARILRDRASLQGERRTVTVLFIDAVSSVSTSEKLDPEDVHRIIQGCVERMIAAVNRFEGTVTQFRGDGIMALFGAPIAHEDSARRAVSAALAMRAALAAYGQELVASGSKSLSFRIGLNTGPVIVGSVGDDLTMDYTAVGDTVNLAARMEQWASTGGIYITEHTRRAVADYFELTDLGPLEIKGKAEPVPSYEVLRELPARTRFEVSVEHGLTRYVGRSEELSVLRAHFEQARRGNGQVVFVSGEAGIGKSRLLLEFRNSIGPDEATWTEGHCISYGRGIPYLPIIGLARATFGVEESDDDAAIIARIDQTAGQWEAGAHSTAPYLKYLLNVDPNDDRVAPMDPIERRPGILDALRAMVGEAARNRPQVLVVEDLHWIDGASEEALAALVDVVAASAVLLILTYRPGYTHALGDRSYYARLALQQLPADDAAAIAASVLGVESLPAELQSLVTARAEGNPFFVEEVTKSLVESRVLRRDDGAYVLTKPASDVLVPDTIQEVILGRIDRLAHDARGAIQLASVIGREFTARLLERISDPDARLDGVLGELKALELIYQKAYFPELAYMFKHALTHEVALSTLLHERRKALHRIVAAAVEELYADRLPEQYEVLAYHYDQGEDWERALLYLEKAGDKSAAAYANAQAVAFFGRAVEVCERVGPSALRSAVDIGHKRGRAAYLADELPTAIACLTGVYQAAVHLGDPRARGIALIRRGVNELWEHIFDTAIATLTEAMTIGEEGEDPELQFLARFWLGTVMLIIGRQEEADAWFRDAGELPDCVKDEYDLRWWEIIRSARASWSGRWDDALTELRHMPPPPDEGGSAERWVEYIGEVVFVHMQTGAYETALELNDHGRVVAVRIGHVFWAARMLNTRGYVLEELQDHEGAMPWNQRCIDEAIALNAPDPEVENNARINLGDNLLSMGRLDEAEEQFEVVERTIRNPRPQDLWILWSYSQHLFHSYGQLCLARGDATRALSYAEECIALAERTDRPKNAAKGRRLRGQALLAMGDLMGADAEIERSLSIALTIGNPTQIWQTHAAQGDLRRAQSRDDDARAAYADALTVISEVAAGLTDSERRNTFLNSTRVTEIRAKHAAVAVSP